MVLDRPSSCADVIVIGGGPAGAAVAALMVRSGFSVIVLERAHFPRFVIGESLLPRALDVLEEAGLLPAVEAQGYEIKDGAVFVRDGERVEFSFGTQFSGGGRPYAYQVPRAHFDQLLAVTAGSMGAEFRYGHTVREVRTEGESVTVLVDNDEGESHQFRGRFLLDGSGYGRVLPRLFGLDRPSAFPPRSAIFTHMAGDKRPPGRTGGRIWVSVHPECRESWSWVIPFSDGRTSIGSVLPLERAARYTTNPTEGLRDLISSDPVLSERVGGGIFLFDPVTLTGYSCSTSAFFGERFALLGNATEFLDPIFSSGVTLALESSRLAANCLRRSLHGERVDWGRDYEDPLRRGVNAFRTFVDGWYNGSLQTLFFSPERPEGVVRKVCSILAGYVWDETNPLVRDPERAIVALAALCRSEGVPAHQLRQSVGA
jgi:flavin-dependent dehydrogenase